MTKFSEYLQREMDKRDWSQADLMRAANTTSKNVSVWMDDVIPRGDGLAKIARAFRVPEDEVRKAAGRAPKSGYFKLSQERQEDADTLDREQARIVNDLIRKFADDNRGKVVGHDVRDTSNTQAAGSAATADDEPATEEDDTTVTPIFGSGRVIHGVEDDEEDEDLAASPENDGVLGREGEDE